MQRSQILTSDAGEDPERYAAKLLEVIILQCKGHIDQVRDFENDQNRLKFQYLNYLFIVHTFFSAISFGKTYSRSENIGIENYVSSSCNCCVIL